MGISGELLAIISAIFIGLANPIAVQASKEIGVFQLAVYSSILSAIFFLVFSLIIKQKTQIKKSMKKYPKEMMSITLYRSVIGSLLMFYGFSLTSAIHSVFMLRLEPIFVTVFGYMFLKDKVNLKQIFLILAMIFGAFLLSTSGNIQSFSQAQVGDLFIILSLLFYAYSYIPIKRIGKEINASTLLIVNNFIGGIILLTVSPFLSINLLTINTTNIWLLGGYIILFSIVGLYFYFASLEKTKPWIVSSLLALSSIVGAGLAYIWLGETMNIIQIFGALIILTSSFFIIKK